MKGMVLERAGTQIRVTDATSNGEQGKEGHQKPIIGRWRPRVAIEQVGRVQQKGQV